MPADKDYLQRLLDERLRAVGEERALLAEIQKRKDPKPTAEDVQTLERMGEAIDDMKRQIDLHLGADRRDRENDQLRGELDSIIRPQTRSERLEEPAPSQDMVLEQFIRTRGREGADSSGGFEVDLRPIARAKSLIRMGATQTEFRDYLFGAGRVGPNAAQFRDYISNVSTGVSGASLVPSLFAATLYDFLEVYTGIRRTNVRVVTTSGGESMDFPVVTAHGTAAIVGESTALAEADAAFGKVNLTAFKYGVITQISTEMIQDSGVPVLDFIATDSARSLARVTDTAYMTGSGSNAPKGALAAMGVGATVQTVATGVPSYANLVDLCYSINNEYRDNGSQWLFKDAFVGTLRKLADTTGRPLFEPGWTLGTPDRLLGYPVLTDPNFGSIGTAASTVGAFGDWSTFLIRDVGSVRFERSDEFAFTSDLVTFRAVLRTDSDLIDTSGSLKKLIEPST